MRVWYKCSILGRGDRVFITDSNKNNNTFLGAFYFDKFDYETMRLSQMQRAETIPRCKTKLVKYFGIDWFQDMDPEEWEGKKHYSFVRKDCIHTMEALCNFMMHEQAIREPYDYQQYRLIYIPDFSEDTSVIVFKAHHCFLDAVSGSTFI